MPSSKPPPPPSPAESASAAVQSTLAGDIYHTLNAPIQGYTDLYLQSLLGPTRAQLSSGLAAQTALQGAMAQKDIQSRTDPQVYAMRQMNLNAAQSRLAGLYGMDPTTFSYRAPSVYATPTSAQIPALSSIDALTKATAANMVPVSLDKGGNINIGQPSGGMSQVPGSVLPALSPGAMPSYLGVA
jgi:hypothetical protein